MKQTLLAACEVELIKTIKADPNMMLPLRLKCTQCQEEYHNLIMLDPSETHPIKNSRGEAHVVLGCKFCKKDANIELIEFLEYNVEEPVNGEIEFPFAKLESRGCEIIGCEPQGPFIINNIEADLSDDWIEVLDSGECLQVFNLKGSVK